MNSSITYFQKEKIKNSVLSRIIPFQYIKIALWAMLVLFISPILILCVEPNLVKDEKTTRLILWTLSIIFFIYTVFIGIALIFYKVPFLQELKEKFGYTEK